MFLLVVSCEKDNLSDLEDVFYVRRNGADIPTYVYGNGAEKTFLVFLHGGPGESALPVRSTKAFKELEDNFAVVYFDQRGQGMSQGHYPKTKHNIWEMAKDIKALALILKEKYGNEAKLFLMGHSWGGALGFVSLIDNDTQDLFSGWIEVGGSHDSPLRNQGTIDMVNKIGNEQIDLNNSEQFWSNAILRANEYDINNKEDCKKLNRDAYAFQNLLRKDGVMNAYQRPGWEGTRYRVITENPLTTFINEQNILADILKTDFLVNFSIIDSLYKIELPTLFLWGEYDFAAPKILAEMAMSKIESEFKELVVLEKSGHGVIIQQPTEFVNEVTHFINGNR
jgi:pimeloyl-ACP methyl ester carboxylesterase